MKHKVPQWVTGSGVHSYFSSLVPGHMNSSYWKHSAAGTQCPQRPFVQGMSYILGSVECNMIKPWVTGSHAHSSRPCYKVGPLMGCNVTWVPMPMDQVLPHEALESSIS